MEKIIAKLLYFPTNLLHASACLRVKAVQMPNLRSRKFDTPPGEAPRRSGKVSTRTSRPHFCDRLRQPIRADHLVLFGDCYFTVIEMDGKLGLLHADGFEELSQAWCDCGLIVGSHRIVQIP